MSDSPTLTPEQEQRLEYLARVAQLMRRHGVHALQDGTLILTLGLEPAPEPKHEGEPTEPPQQTALGAAPDDPLWDAAGGSPPVRQPSLPSTDEAEDDESEEEPT